MKDEIGYYYNLYPETIDEANDRCSFYVGNIKYLFVPYLRPVEDLEELYYLNDELLQKRIPSHTIVTNKDKKVLTKYRDANFILLRLNADDNKLITLTDMNLLANSLRFKKTKSNLYRSDWSELWSKKIDYFEYQIREVGKGKEVILNSFSYYVGLAENAIAYASEANNDDKAGENDIITLSHRRIFYPNYALNYFNPLSYIFDLEIRDIAEYIKAMFFENHNVWEVIDEYFSKKSFTAYSYRMFFARLLFPSYYFDIYEDVLNKNKDEQELIPIIEKVDEYEEFLAEMYIYINKRVSIPRVEWLIKKE